MGFLNISWRFGFHRFWHPHIDDEDCYAFEEGFRVVATKRVGPAGNPVEYGYIDKSNEIAFNHYFKKARSFCCGLAMVEDKNDEVYYINTTGERAFAMRFSYCEDYDWQYKVAYIRDENEIGYHIKTDGNKLYDRIVNIVSCDSYRFRPEFNAVACDAKIKQPNGTIIKCVFGFDGRILAER